MHFRDFITPERIIPNLSASTKSEAMIELVEPVFTSKAVSPDVREGILSAVFHREELAPTAVGQGLGLAIPHAKHPGVRSIVGVFGRSVEGIPFDSPDGEPVHLFVLLLSNGAHADKHLEALAYISRRFRDKDFRNLLLRAAKKSQLVDLLEDYDGDDSV